MLCKDVKTRSNEPGKCFHMFKCSTSFRSTSLLTILQFAQAIPNPPKTQQTSTLEEKLHLHSMQQTNKKKGQLQTVREGLSGCARCKGLFLEMHGRF